MAARDGLGLAFGALILVAGCLGPGETRPDVYAAIATRSGGGGMTALLDGRLVAVDGCLWVETPDGTRYLPIWPRGTSVHGVPDGPGIVVVYRARELVIGPAVALGGGESPLSADDIDEELVAPIPAACRAGPFWGVSEVVAE